MTHKNIYSEDTLIQLYRLNGYDTERIIVSEGKICFDPIKSEFYVYIPSLEASLHYPTHLDNRLASKLSEEDYDFKLSDMVLSVTSEKHFPSSFLMQSGYRKLVEKHIDICADTAVMISEHHNTPLFFGKQKILDRLAEDFDSYAKVVSLNDFDDRRIEYVQS
jgi:hypothetical protein